ncbi:MAG: YybH family protein [Woeseiaceae bacterium]
MTSGLNYFLLFSAVCFSGCTEPAIDIEVEKEILMQVSRDWSTTVEAGDYKGALDYWADDGVMLPPDFPLLKGKEAITEYVMGAAEIPGFKISWEPLSAHIAASGDLGYLVEKNVIEFDGEDGEKVVTHGKVVTVWRRGADGQWRNVVDMWNTAPPPD